MKTEEQLKAELKEQLEFCNHVNDGSLAAQVNEQIQWAWDNWDIDFSVYFEGEEKPDNYTADFRDNYIDTTPFDSELEHINNPG